MSVGDTSARLVVKLVNTGARRDVQVISRPRSSSLYDACMRMHVLAKKYKVKKVSPVSLQSRITYGIGDCVHSWIQNTDALFSDEARHGWWSCPICGRRLHFGTKRKRICPRCRAKTEGIYTEHVIKTGHPFVCGGHPDLFLLVDGKLRVAELKTIAVDQFKTLVAPKIEHNWQIQYYMWSGAKDKTLPMKIDGSVGYVVYIAKQEVRSSFPIKIFDVQKDKLIVKQFKSKLRIYSEAVKEGYLPAPEDRCYESDWSHYKATSCPVMRECRGAE